MGKRGSAKSGAIVAVPSMLAYAAVLAWGARAGAWPGWAIAVPAALSAITFLTYWQDKRAAQRNRQRTPEHTLHALSLAGGWPGAWAAQQVLRHKSSKPSFLAVYWLTVAAHCASIGGWLYLHRG